MADVTGDFDNRALRDALGMFATGVVVITTRDADGDDVGLTVNSFTSVSLQPPLVLFCLAREAGSATSFTDGTVFGVNVLARDQEELSNNFARPDDDKFQGVDVLRSPEGVPLLPGCLAHLECRTERLMDGGDHVILLARVLRLKAGDLEPPLLFFGGRYATITD